MRNLITMFLVLAAAGVVLWFDMAGFTHLAAAVLGGCVITVLNWVDERALGDALARFRELTNARPNRGNENK